MTDNKPTSTTPINMGGKLDDGCHPLTSATTLQAVLVEQASSDDGTAIADVVLFSGEMRQLTVHRPERDQAGQTSQIFPCELLNDTDGQIKAKCVLNGNGTGQLLINFG